ncbi:DedA family protein [Puteibacter caeruleilacunae]|nr:DedA family protein [Puteibacter caeruleilacunae]
MFEDIIFQLGYPGIFLISFIASTLFPLGSEGFVIMAVTSEYNSWLVWLFATAGNFAGAVTNYYVGYYGDRFILSKYIKVASDKKEKAQKLFAKWGAPVLFFSWLPIIGDPLCVIPGVLKLKLHIFSFWVLLGKAFRYFLVIWSTHKALGY